MPELTRREILKIGAGTVAGLGVIGGASALGFDLHPVRNVKLALRIDGATEAHSICPYCAVGCSLIAYTRKESNGDVKLLQIEGDPNSPINEGRLRSGAA